VLVKIGDQVQVSVRRASSGTDLASLRDAVRWDYLTLDALALGARAAAQKLESGFVGRFARFHAE
jgi:F-type H+-transporting ATPase subunit epsilon